MPQVRAGKCWEPCSTRIPSHPTPRGRAAHCCDTQCLRPAARSAQSHSPIRSTQRSPRYVFPGFQLLNGRVLKALQRRPAPCPATTRTLYDLMYLDKWMLQLSWFAIAFFFFFNVFYSVFSSCSKRWKQ